MRYGLPNQPPTDSPILHPFWEGAENSELRVSECPVCEMWRWYPESVCNRCQTAELPVWRRVSGLGRVFTWTRVHRPFVRTTGKPYLVGLIELEESHELRIAAPILMEEDPVVGLEVRVEFVIRETYSLPCFVPQDA